MMAGRAMDMTIDTNSTVQEMTEAVVSKTDHKESHRTASPEKAQTATKSKATKSSQAIEPEEWSIEQSEELYRINGWGDPYFSINAVGHVTVSPKGLRGGSLDLYDLVNGLKQRNLELPLLIRFSDILEDRIERLNACFAKAIARYNYPGIYRGVFPVKCNQQRHFVENLVKFGQPYQFGLEAGSKPELLIALASLDTKGALVICNGYKDQEYVETAMLAQKLGQTAIVVMEQVDKKFIPIVASDVLLLVDQVRAHLHRKGESRDFAARWMRTEEAKLSPPAGCCLWR